MTRVLNACHLGFTPYAEGLRIQQAAVDARAAGATGDWLLFPDHPPVLTVGRSPSDGNLRADREALARRGLEVFEVSRGGDVTWHGPGQLVGYPIIELTALGRDLHRYLRELEGALIDVLGAHGIAAERSAGRTGVWSEGEKIASIGIAVRRWVGYHGFALNVAPNLGDFDLIHPCGLRGIRMTSMAARLGDQAPGIATVRTQVAEALAARLGFEAVSWQGRLPEWNPTHPMGDAHLSGERISC
jgi:lipoate-protein ligase B